MVREAIGQIRIYEAFFKYCKVTREAVALCGQIERWKDPENMAAAYSIQQIDGVVAYAAGQAAILHLILQIRIKEETDNLAYFARIARIG